MATYPPTEPVFSKLLWAAALGSIASFLFKAHEVAFPGLPASTVIDSKNIPFFQHMLLCAWVAILAYFMGNKPARYFSTRLHWLTIAIILSTVATAALQWLYPNY
jgi:hypothetical protein